MEFPPSLQDVVICLGRFQPPCGWLISSVPAGQAWRDGDAIRSGLKIYFGWLTQGSSDGQSGTDLATLG